MTSGRYVNGSDAIALVYVNDGIARTEAPMPL
jgi:hypothetical protein